MDSRNLQAPEEMLERWYGTTCQCDSDVGRLCELCHDIQVVRDLLARRDSLEGSLIKIATERNQFCGISLDYMQGYRDAQEHLAKVAREALGTTKRNSEVSDE